MFPISRLIIGGAAAGTYVAYSGGLACANPVAMPSGFLIPLKSTVLSSMTVQDIIQGLASIALEITIDAAWNKIFKGAWYHTWAKGLEPMLDPKIVGLVLKERKIMGMTLKESKIMLKVPTHLEALVGKETCPEIVLAVYQMNKWRDLPTMFYNKSADHVLKSWLVSPLFTGSAKGNPGVGRGHWTLKFFGE